MLAGAGDVYDAIQRISAQILQFVDDGADAFFGPPAAQRELPAVARERARDAEPDPARAAGHDGDASRRR